ncbi:MAG: heme exporter protein CcmB [Gammaproteobacteria bacterium]|nr:heme exporter protein CcmB [Gammaproteobacteria bacterium]
MNALSAVARRDFRVALRRWGQLANPLVFFAIVATLFPLSLSPDSEQLRDIGIGVLWVAALLASLLMLDALFQSDVDDGSMDQLLLSPTPLVGVVLARTAVHWCVTGLPLLAIAPLVALAFYLPLNVLPVLLASLLFGTATLSAFGAIGASLTINLKFGGGLLGLLILPLTVPVLIFGSRATDMALHGESAAGPLYLLAAMMMLAISLAPVATAAAIRTMME